MAVKFVNVKQTGKYINNEKKYYIEIEKKNTAELFNFYMLKEDESKGMLICSVYTKYLSKATGVKKAGEFEREIFGDYEVFSSFNNFLYEMRNRKDKDLSVSRKMIVDRKNGGFLDLLEKKGNLMYIKQGLSEGNIMEEVIQDINSETGGAFRSAEYSCTESGKTVKATKLKGIDYKFREGGEKDINRNLVKDLNVIALEKDITWVKSKRYKVINTKEEFEEYLLKIDEHNDIIGFDTETTGLRINRFPVGHPQRDYMVGICISLEEDEGVYIPIGHKYFENLDEDYVIEGLRPYLCSTSPKKKSLATHYGSFDWKVMYTYGIKLNIVNDSYILQYMINNSEFRGRKNLKELAKKELGVDMIELDDLFLTIRGRKVDKNFSILPLESVRHYAPADADMTRILTKNKIPQLLPSMKFLYWVEVELMKYLAKMEYYGIKLDVEMLVTQTEEAEKEKEMLAQNIYKFVGREFNINSTKELPKILYEELKYPVLSKTDKEEPSTGVIALKMLAKERNAKGEEKHPLAQMLLDYRAQEKLLGGFLYKMLKENIDGYIFPGYNQTGTDSGRIACSRPNLQQSPGKQRSVFRTDNDDYYFIIVDYSQVEYRIMAGLANEVEVVEAFKSYDTDFHVTMYAKMNNMDPDDVTSAMRKIGKILNFGITYGMGPLSLAYTLFKDTSPEKVKEAQELTDRYFESVPNIRDMLREAKDRAYLYGYIETKFGRRRYFPDIQSKESYIRTSNMRRAANTKVQGTGADILKIAHVKVEREIEKRKLDVRVIISMHDELVLQVHKSINPWDIIRILRQNMELEIPGFPPLFIGINVGSTWAAGKRDDLEIPVAMTNVMFEKVPEGTPGYTDPEAVVEKQIKEFIVSKISSMMSERGFDTVEKALDFPKIEKLTGDYFGKKESISIIESILNNEEFKLDVKKEIVYNDSHLEYDNEDGESSEDGEEVVRERVDEVALQRLHIEDKDRLVLPSPFIKTAQEFYKTDYRVMVHDKKCFIRIDEIKSSVLKELKEYFEDNNCEVGNKVVLVNKGKTIETPYRLNKIDKIGIIMILDKHLSNEKTA